MKNDRHNTSGIIAAAIFSTLAGIAVGYAWAMATVAEHAATFAK